MLENSEVGRKLTDIFKKAFNNPDLEITSTTSSLDIDGWDSLLSIELFFMIEQEFSIRFSPLEIIQIRNVGELHHAILKKKAEPR